VKQLHDLDVAARALGGRSLVECNQAVERDRRPGPWHAGKQRKQLGLDFERDIPRPRAQGGQKTRKLQRVAKSMIAADKDVPRVDRPAIPNPALMVRQRRIVLFGRITRGGNGVRYPPSRFIIAAPNRGYPGILLNWHGSRRCRQHRNAAPAQTVARRFLLAFGI
jgi:hypothetical protein